MLKPQVNPQFSDLTELELLKEEACQFVKGVACEQITRQYPYYKQLNVIAQGEVAAKSEMTEFINARRRDCDAMEAAINACQTVATLAALSFLNKWVDQKRVNSGG